ncbi:RIP metalloprotease RseP [Celeribacter indicus]|uniref:Zinc metalloprotease n=1 Tax=Celeribacter indicus TaxID=1208324 RepID=A0A0B5E2S4_9RHOB|nr:RIP metalloprotease RseP [Celeribacter indicus]AJE47331.1 protease ecfE [Celeribacter indicus]SDW03697.1 regulator of sigma E protease [Celeribacter indicus]
MYVTTLLGDLGGLAYTLVSFVIALSIIVTVHEYGHYIVGRWSGIKADVFSLGFGKVLWSRKDRRGTQWQIAALPFGGYVKFAGDANAASAPDPHAVDGLPPEQARHTMPGAPLWARTATVAAGPVFNFVFSFIVFTAFLLASGQVGERLIVDEVAAMPVPVALEPGDEVIAIEGAPVPEMADFFSFVEALPHGAALSYTVLRDGAEVTVEAPHPYPVIVAGISPKSAARDAGLRVGDVITALDGTPVPTFRGLQDHVMSHDGAPMTLTIWRPDGQGGETFETTLEPRRRDLPRPEGGFETRWLIGITGGLLFQPGTEPAGIGEAMAYGVQSVWQIIVTSISGIWHMITGAISTCNLSGPVGIAETASTMASQGTSSFIWFIAMLSTAIGMLNLFPVPVLDGGHLVFYAYEAVRGKPLPDRAVGVMMTAGLAVILFLMLMGLGADLFCR